jgi:type IVB pilus formation R64 PilN family outer membrane protein
MNVIHKEPRMKSTKHFVPARVSLLALSISLTLLSGCANLKFEDDTAKQSADYVEREQAKIQQPQPVGVRTSDSWLLGETVDLQPEISPILQRKIGWHPSKKVSLAELAAYITSATSGNGGNGLPVDVSEVMRIGGATAQDQLIAPGVGSIAGSTIAAPSGLVGVPGATGTTGQRSYMQLPLFNVDFDGDVKGLLDYAANEEGIYWNLDGGTVKFFRTLSKTFEIPALNRKTSGTNAIQAQSSSNSGSTGSVGTGVSSGSSGSGSGSSGLNASATTDVDFWENIETTVKTVAGSDALVAVNKAFMSVTVTGTPMEVHNVEEWVKGISDHTSQMVLIVMHTYRVTLSTEDYINWNPEGVFNKMSSLYGITLTGAGAPPVSGSLTPAVISATAGSSSNLNGSQIAFGALSTLGNVKEGITQSTMSLNGQPSIIQVGNNKTYIASNGTTSTANVGTTSQATPGVASSGFTIKFTPNVINGKVYLDMDLNDITLNAIDQITTNGEVMQLPNISPTLITESAALTPGQALLMSSITIDNTSATHSGTFSPYNPLLGGGVDGTRAKQLIAVVVTATVL